MQLEQALIPISNFIESKLFTHVIRATVGRNGTASIDAGPGQVFFSFGFTEVGPLLIPTTHNIRIENEIHRLGDEGKGIVTTMENSFPRYKLIGSCPVTYAPFWEEMGYRQFRGNFYLKKK